MSAQSSVTAISYDAVRDALVVLWEAADRICGKRLKAILPMLTSALERHQHLQMEPTVRAKLMVMSAATIDRLLREVRAHSSVGRRRRVPTALRRRVAIRTFDDWNDPPPGYMEMDLVAHCGGSAVGSYVHTLSATDLFSGWTECIPLVVRAGSLVIESIDTLQVNLPFSLRGLDVDNVLRTKASFSACDRHPERNATRDCTNLISALRASSLRSSAKSEILADHNEHKIRRVTTAFTAPKTA